MKILKFVWYLGLGSLVEGLIILPLCLVGLVIITPIYWVMCAWYKANGKEIRVP